MWLLRLPKRTPHWRVGLHHRSSHRTMPLALCRQVVAFLLETFLEAHTPLQFAAQLLDKLACQRSVSAIGTLPARRRHTS